MLLITESQKVNWNLSVIYLIWSYASEHVAFLHIIIIREIQKLQLMKSWNVDDGRFETLQLPNRGQLQLWMKGLFTGNYWMQFSYLWSVITVKLGAVIQLHSVIQDQCHHLTDVCFRFLGAGRKWHAYRILSNSASWYYALPWSQASQTFFQGAQLL